MGPADGVCAASLIETEPNKWEANPDPDCNPAGSSVPATEHMGCGTVYWCCYVIECADHSPEKLSDNPICPKHYGWGSMPTRYIADYIWTSIWIEAQMAEFREKYKTKACYVNEENCRDKPGAATCGKYPAP